jgi:undecaprenyl-phosphate 4-deoxy-4-formamido-L-arabinose transferase
MPMYDFSIVIPVFNAASSIAPAVDEIHNCLHVADQNFEIILVDDNSEDESWTVLKTLQKKYPYISVIRLARNYGQHAATLCGMKYAKGKFIATLDDDLEVHPKQLFVLLEEQGKHNVDVVYGEYPKSNSFSIRSIFTWVYKLLSKIEGPTKGRGSSFRLIKKELADKLVHNHQQFVFIDEVLLWYTDQISFIPVPANPLAFRKKRYKLKGLLNLTSNVIMFSSAFPLKFVTVMGFSLAIVNFLIGIFYLVKKTFFNIMIPGYTSLIVSILFSTGLIIFCIGIIALYVRQMLRNTNNAPSYNEFEVIEHAHS